MACFGVGILAAAVSFVSACQEERARGQLVVTFQTDMALPTQIDNVSVTLTRRGGNVLHMLPYTIGGSINDSPIPGSLVLNAGEVPEPITITVAGSKSDVWKTYREIVTTVPRDRVAELRMPIQWLCNDAAQPQVVSMPDGKGGQISRVVPTCEEGYTCKAGSCVANEVDSATLPDFDPTQLYGGAKDPEEGSCFDVLQCMGSGTAVVPDADCTIERPEDESFNVALRVAGGGICNESGPVTTCFVPLDGNDPEGWAPTEDGLRLQLPVAVCDRIADRKVLAVQTSTSCRTKTPSLPACGSWSVVPADHAVVPDPTTAAPTWPSPELFARLPTMEVELCCPLLTEGNKLFSCMCSTKSPDATVYAIDMDTEQQDAYPVNKHPTFAASVFNQTVYWATSAVPNDELNRLPLQTGAALTVFPALGGLYTAGVMLSDASGQHVLTSGIGTDAEETSKVVYMLHFGPNGDITSMDPLGNRVVKQFTQDANAFYAAMNVDELKPEGQPFQRVSSAVRIDKATHQVTPLLAAQTMTISDLRFNGYLGVVSDGTDVFALSESAPVAGREHLVIGRIAAPSGGAVSELVPLYDLEVSADPHFTILRLLGAVDGAVFFARDELLQADRLRSSSVLVIPRGETTARFVADFSADAAVTGIAANKDRVFWLNQSGRIFALSREALAP